MIDSSDIPEPIQWSEGMLLGPHHFQQAARRSDALLHYHLGRAVPYWWGVSQLQIDPVRLAAGTVSILLLEAVMPDGIVVTHPAADGGDLQVDLAQFAARLQDEPLKIYLIIPGHRGGASLVAGQLARYRSVEGAPVVDENTGDNGVILPRLRPQLALHAGDKPSQNFTSLPLAEVMHRNEGFELTGFYPPPLPVTARSALAGRCRDLLQRVRAKASFVAERLHAPGAELRQATVIELRHSLHCLVGNLPVFEAILESGTAHPFEIYLTVCRLAGNLALLGGGVVPPLFDRYDHDDVQRSFEPLLAFADRMLETVSETHIPVAFTYEAGAFRLMMEPAWLQDDLLIGVRARPRQNEREVNAWIDEAVIASSERVGRLGETRVRGAARRQLTAEEDLEFLPARGTFIYRVTADGNFILPRRVLEIVNPSDRAGDRRPVEIVLYVPTEQQPARPGGFAPGAAPDGDVPPRGPR
jgi:type VI secretion system protein ImpJ